MLPYQERALDEHAELLTRTSKLRTFIDGPEFARLPHRMKDQLVRQEAAMLMYLDVLAERIADFPKP